MRNVLTALALGCFLLCGHAAKAQTTVGAAGGPTPIIETTGSGGCDKKIMDAAWAKGKAQQVKNYALTQQLVPQPDSQLFMDCFNQIAKLAKDGTNGGGAIFSGDLGENLWTGAGKTYPNNPPTVTTNTYYQKVIEDALKTFGNQFPDSEGGQSTVVDYTQTALPGAVTQNCNEIHDKWERDKAIGEQPDTPFMFDADLRDTAAVSGTLGSSGAQPLFKDTLTNDATAFSDYKTAFGTSPTTGVPSPAVPFFTINQASTTPACDQLITAGLTSVTCP